MVHNVYYKFMPSQTQQELLRALKSALKGTWDDVAAETEIPARTLKSYRLPSISRGARKMDKFTREKVERTLGSAQITYKKTIDDGTQCVPQ